MAEKARVQYKGTADPESWQDVDATHPLPVTSGNTTVTNMPPISFEGGGGTETTVSDANPLPVDVIETTDVDDDNIAKDQELPLKIVETYIFSKSANAWIRTQASADGYQFVTPMGVYDAAGHGLDIEVTTGAVYTNLKAFRSSDNTYQPVRLDKATNTIQTMSYEHHEIHSGSSFTSGHKVDLGNGAVLDLLIVTPDTTKWSHLTYEIEGELETDIILYEGATASNNGTAVTAFNRDRNSLTASTTLTFHTPTVAGGAEGTAIRTWHFGSGRSFGGGDRGTHELILKQNTKYLLRITNATSNSNYVSVKFDWYEHINIA